MAVLQVEISTGGRNRSKGRMAGGKEMREKGRGCVREEETEICAREIIAFNGNDYND